jgi:hypothetical protein
MLGPRRVAVGQGYGGAVSVRCPWATAMPGGERGCAAGWGVRRAGSHAGTSAPRGLEVGARSRHDGVAMTVAHTRRVEWLARQMYSHEAPIGREQIEAAFAAALAELVGTAVDEPVKIAEREVEGSEYISYWAAHQTWRMELVGAGEAALIYEIDPILASMGVSGEEHRWHGEGLPAGVELRGSALSSGRQNGFAELVLYGLGEARARVILERFAAAFPEIRTSAALAAEEALCE